MLQHPHYFFIDIKSFRSHYGLGVDSAYNRNEYQEHFLGGKGDRCVRLTTLPPSCAVVMKSGNLNFLEPSGPLQVCNGTALPLQYPHYCGKPSHEMKLRICVVEEILLPNSGVSYFINYVAPCHRGRP